MEKRCKAISPVLQKLRVGEKVKYPIDKLFSVRTLACTKGLELNRTFTTKIDRTKKVIIVTRTA